MRYDIPSYPLDSYCQSDKKSVLVEKRGPLHMVDGNVGVALMENSMEFPREIKTVITI
jgi:hypothetical protein